MSTSIINADSPSKLTNNMDTRITKSTGPRRQGEAVQNAHQANDDMRRYWNSTVCKEFNIPDHYRSVAVLLIHWADWLDSGLNCRDETAELKAMFGDRYSFTTDTVVLDCNKWKPQHQLNSAVAEFVRMHDGPYRTNLLIVYYSGHGVTKLVDGCEDEQLFISGVQTRKELEDAELNHQHEPSCHWQNAESLLQHAEADVLTIMDSCYATASMNKALRDVTRSFETIAATHKLTLGPGPGSLTRALITALSELCGDTGKTEQRPFDTQSLHARIDDIMRRTHPSHRLPRLYNRNESQNSRHICLAPIARSISITSGSRRAERPAGVLHIQVVFSEHHELNKEQTVLLGSSLASAAKSAIPNITALDWIKFDPRPLDVRSTMTIAIFLKKWIRRWRDKQRRRSYGQIRDRLVKRAREESDVFELLKRPRYTW